MNNSSKDGSMAISAFKSMAADPVKRVILARDPTCIGGLIMVLSNPDNRIVKSSLETILLLTECKEEVEFLASFMGMKTQVKNIMERESPDTETYKLAKKLIDAFNQECTKAVFVKDCGSSTSIEGCTPKRLHKRRRNFFLGGNAGKGKTIVLQVKGLKDKDDMDVCRNNLIRIKGVISITFDFPKKRAIVRVRLDIKPEHLVYAILQSETMSAEQVVRGDNGEEVFVSFGANVADDKENDEDLPQYLPDDASPVKIGENPVVKHGIQYQHETSWLGKAASFLSNSFYW